MAAFYFFYEWNWKKAEEEERRATELNPNMSEAYHVLSYILFAQNRVDDAVEAQRRATEVDPFARPWALGYVLTSAGRYAEAEAELRQELEVRPTNTDVRDTLAAVLLAEGKEKESAKELADSARRDGVHSPRLVRMWMESEFKWLHGDGDFRALARRVGLVLPLGLNHAVWPTPQTSKKSGCRK